MITVTEIFPALNFQHLYGIKNVTSPDFLEDMFKKCQRIKDLITIDDKDSVRWILESIGCGIALVTVGTYPSMPSPYAALSSSDANCLRIVGKSTVSKCVHELMGFCKSARKRASIFLSGKRVSFGDIFRECVKEIHLISVPPLYSSQSPSLILSDCGLTHRISAVWHKLV